MIALKIASLLILLTLPSCALGQKSTPNPSDPTDSTVLIPIPRWMHWRAIHDLKRLPACDTAVMRLQAENENNLKRLANADSAITNLQDRNKLLHKADSASQARIEVKDQVIDILKGKADKWKVVSGVLAILLTLALIAL